jgi:hypothetical protein
VSHHAIRAARTRRQTVKPAPSTLTHGWPAYENYCEDLLSFLFVPPLNPPIPQSRDERHVNRRDYVLPNYATDFGFWQFMRTHHEAHLVVAEVKKPEPRTRQERDPAGSQLPEPARHRAVRPDPRPR